MELYFCGAQTFNTNKSLSWYCLPDHEHVDCLFDAYQ